MSKKYSVCFNRAVLLFLLDILQPPVWSLVTFTKDSAKLVPKIMPDSALKVSFEVSFCLWTSGKVDLYFFALYSKRRFFCWEISP